MHRQRFDASTGSRRGRVLGRLPEDMAVRLPRHALQQGYGALQGLQVCPLGQNGKALFPAIICSLEDEVKSAHLQDSNWCQACHWTTWPHWGLRVLAQTRSRSQISSQASSCRCLHALTEHGAHRLSGAGHMANEGSHTCSVSIPPSVSMMASLILGFCSLRRLNLGSASGPTDLAAMLLNTWSSTRTAAAMRVPAALSFSKASCMPVGGQGRLRGELLGLHVNALWTGAAGLLSSWAVQKVLLNVCVLKGSSVVLSMHYAAEVCIPCRVCA